MTAESAARQIQRSLLGPTGQVRRVTPNSLWYRSDGSCSLRYRVAVSVGSDISEHTVLARVHPSDDMAERSPADDAHRLLPMADPPAPWRQWTNAPDADGVSLWVFPADPDLPTLGAAMNLAALSGVHWPCRTAQPRSVDLVRHSRQGAAVLRYGVQRSGATATPSSDVVYGKVYPDSTTGQRVHRFLESRANPTGLVIPRSLGYSATMNLALTEALHGLPLPSVIRGCVQPRGDTPRAPRSNGSAYQALAASGRALAALHDIRQATAPARTLGDLTAELEVQLGMVQQVWPRAADHVRSLLDRVVGWDRVVDDGEGAPAVLCHGDFTPSQVLLADGPVCGVVDFDTACWGEAAMDLGRFLAHLDLLVSKEYGLSAEHMRRELADSFVAGYADSPGVAAPDEHLRQRIALYRSLSLASTALRACRQLKERRLSLALSLLSTSYDPTGKAPYETVV